MQSQRNTIKIKVVLASLALLSFYGIQNIEVKADTVKTKVENIDLPKPYATKSSMKFSKVIGWSKGKTPIAPEGFTVTKFADNFINPRNIYIAPNQDIFISEANTEVSGIMRLGANIVGASKSDRLDKSANRIILLRDSNNDGVPDKRTIFITGLNQPYGMLVLKNYFYVANTDGVVRYPYKSGDTIIKGKGQKILSLPKAGRHWVRNIVANKNGSKIYIAVGSSSNVAEDGFDKEIRRANILEINPDGSGEKIYASG
ncbi:MAG: sorbosone dehydrogenase family protein, partial [Candidatus Sericytochromatia bacterium]|nr:sorbosone dehydrogenase family protein [Candidatus Sericytochromatia bacterium]